MLCFAGFSVSLHANRTAAGGGEHRELGTTARRVVLPLVFVRLSIVRFACVSVRSLFWQGVAWSSSTASVNPSVSPLPNSLPGGDPLRILLPRWLYHATALGAVVLRGLGVFSVQLGNLLAMRDLPQLLVTVMVSVSSCSSCTLQFAHQCGCWTLVEWSRGLEQHQTC